MITADHTLFSEWMPYSSQYELVPSRYAMLLGRYTCMYYYDIHEFYMSVHTVDGMVLFHTCACVYLLRIAQK